jgi:hypothetical protein
MSPSRSRKPVAHLRPRSEIYVAIAVGAGIVLGTALLIWLMRPGKTGAPGGGGLFSRQPRVTLFVIVAAIVVAVGLYWLVRRSSSRRSVTAVSAVVVVAAILLAIFWPGGLVRHYQSIKTVDTPPATTPTLPTTVPGTVPRTPTTVKGAATTVPNPATTKGK